MSFYAYENWRARGGTRRDNGKWHGPFADFNAADNQARRTSDAV